MDVQQLHSFTALNHTRDCIHHLRTVSSEHPYPGQQGTWWQNVRNTTRLEMIENLPPPFPVLRMCILLPHSSNAAICWGVFNFNCEMNGGPALLSTESVHVTVSHLDDRAQIVILPYFNVACEHRRWIYRLQEKNIRILKVCPSAFLRLNRNKLNNNL
jgi:hypothetical protein